jgi:hypothetical protein
VGADRLVLCSLFLVLLSVRGFFWLLSEPRPVVLLRRRLRVRRRRGDTMWGAEPQGRPIEVIAEEARLLAGRVHHPPRGTSFAKYEGWRSAYDRALAEGCRALGVEHLLEVLEPGPERDAERARVESLLWLAGLRIDEAA